MSGSLLSFEDLKVWTGYSSKAAIREFLRHNRIWYTEGKQGEPVTTLNHILSATIKDSSNHDEIVFVDEPE